MFDAYNTLKPFSSSRAAKTLKSLGILPDLADALGIGYVPRYAHREMLNGRWRVIGTDRRVLFHYYDYSGREPALSAVSAYAFGPRFHGTRLIEKGQKWRGVFAAPGALQQNPLLFVQSPWDVLALYACGLPALAVSRRGWADWIISLALQRTVCLATADTSLGDRIAHLLSREFAGQPIRCFRLRPLQKTWMGDLGLYGTLGLALHLQADMERGLRKAVRLPSEEINGKPRPPRAVEAGFSWQQGFFFPQDPWAYHSERVKQFLKDHEANIHA
jgi:hypothetical protein